MSDKFLYLCLGLPTWCLINGTFGVLFKLVETQPESYSISSYITVAITIGNMIALYIGLHCRQLIHSQTVPMIRCILLLGLATCVLLALFWSSVTGGVSAALFVLCFSAGVCASTSNILLFTFVSMAAAAAPTWVDSQGGGQGGEKRASVAAATSMLATGMGVGSMLSGLMALCIGSVAGEGKAVHFAIGWYYAVFGLFYAVALWSLQRLCDLGAGGREDRRAAVEDNKLLLGAGGVDIEDLQHPQLEHSSVGAATNPLEGSGGHKLRSRRSSDCVAVDGADDSRLVFPAASVPLAVTPPIAEGEASNRPHSSSSSSSGTGLEEAGVGYEHSDSLLSLVQSNSDVALLLIVLFGTAAVGVGVFPSLISKTCGLFASSEKVLLFATTTACMLDPVSRGATHFVPLTSLRAILGMFLVSLLGTLAMLLLLALPAAGAQGSLPLYHRPYGGVFPALLYVLGLSTYGYLSTCVFIYFNHNKSKLLRPKTAGASGDGAGDEERLLRGSEGGGREGLLGGDCSAGEDDDGVLNARLQNLFRLGSVSAQAGAFCGTVAVFALVLAGGL